MVASFIFGELVTKSPHDGYHVYWDLSDMVAIGFLLGLFTVPIATISAWRFRFHPARSVSISIVRYLAIGAVVTLLGIILALSLVAILAFIESSRFGAAGFAVLVVWGPILLATGITPTLGSLGGLVAGLLLERHDQ